MKSHEQMKHDVNNQLTVVLGRIQLARRAPVGQIDQHLEEAQQAAASIQQTVADYCRTVHEEKSESVQS